ncbi:MAG: serine/threonine-protein kinase [Pyrinomonadaceae bacterium]|nr:serine/threonine-protein kinase [Pyrinomonadaceae bacterium]MCX7640226.1 serine/threonine-protein kinase [Pyrinomonadaceae bacterium]MDW8303929.1 FHA domain-containing serine/threonine-protein kinase [Acidobacteriota bacterium]
MKVVLRVIEGPHRGKAFTFDQPDTFLIGRSETAHLCLPDDPYFSRHHCLLEISPPQVFLRDLDSTNGTYVNGERVKTAYLKNGDRIQGGKTVLEVEVFDESLDEKLGKKTSSLPALVDVGCVNCGRVVSAEVSGFEAGLSYICESCRIKLKNNPETLPGYQMIRILGQGGMGSVILAQSVKDGRLVAIKTLLPEVAVNEQSKRRFLREIEVLASLKHPNIVNYIEHKFYNGAFYLISEFVNGIDAGKLAKQRGGRLDYREVVIIMEQVLTALDYAHSKGYIHRDIKEGNILVSGNYPNYSVKLADFGLAKSFKQTGMSGVTMVGDVAGTVIYMPPEQIRNFKEVLPTADIYAAGMTAYVLLTGSHALDVGRNAGISEIVKAVLEKPIVPIAVRDRDVPQEVAEVVEKALSKKPKERWQTAGQMRQALLEAARL